MDSTGAVIPNAKVVIVNQATNVTVYSGPSDSAGTFVAPQILPGSYRITVSAPGLKQSVTNNVIASVAETASVTVTMEVGASTETVTVTAKDVSLESDTSNISTLITPEEVSNLPLNLRAPENLPAFIPGVTHGGAGDNVNTGRLFYQRSRTANTEVLLNNVSIFVASTGGPMALPSPDGIDELRFLTNNAPAEYGRTSGAVLSASVLSGTDKYHGNAYFLLRNEAIDANTYFNKLSNYANNATPGSAAYKKAPRDRYFQMGGSLGGAVRIPHLYDGRGKTFSFQTTTVRSSRTLPSLPIQCRDTSIRQPGYLT